MPEYISEDDLSKAVRGLDEARLSTQFLRNFVGRDRLRRLTSITGKEIGRRKLLTLVVRGEGADLLARRPRRIGRAKTSIRKKLLENLSDQAVRDLYRNVRNRKAPQQTGRIVNDLANFKWHRGSASALRITRGVRLPDSFAGIKAVGERKSSFEVAPLGSIPPLKPFQRGILHQLDRVLRRRERAMVSCFTGTGKTRMGFEYAIAQLANGKDPETVFWVAQKKELLDQACDTVEQLWPWLSQSYGEALQVFRYLEGSRFQDQELIDRPSLVVATTQQVLARLKGEDPFLHKALARSGLLVIDEAHHALARGHRDLIDAYQALRQTGGRVIGLSATPGRSNIIDPEESQALADLFGRNLIVPGIPEESAALRWFQSEGYLSTLRHRQVPAPSQIAQTLGKLGKTIEEDNSGYRDFTSGFLNVVGGDSQRNRSILKELERLHRDGRRSLVFCCDIQQAELVFQSLLLRGIGAGLIHHKIDRRDRRNTILRFRRGELTTLVNVEVLTTGFDAPKIDTIVMCRPTLSRVLYEQMVGRGMRGPAMGGTPECEVIDFTTNFGRFDEPQAWQAFWREWDAPLPPGIGDTEWSGWDVTEAQPVEAERDWSGAPMQTTLYRPGAVLAGRRR